MWNIRETDDCGNELIWSDEFRLFSVAKRFLSEQVTAGGYDNNATPVWENNSTVSLLGVRWEIVRES